MLTPAMNPQPFSAAAVSLPYFEGFNQFAIWPSYDNVGSNFKGFISKILYLPQ